jgi:hypothetical protein
MPLHNDHLLARPYMCECRRALTGGGAGSARSVLKGVLATTILVSAFLDPQPEGAADELLRLSGAGAFEVYLSEDILAETGDVLLTRHRLRRRHGQELRGSRVSPRWCRHHLQPRR